MPETSRGMTGSLVPQLAQPLADMANEPSKKSFVYSRLSFRVYDWNCPRLDTEWLLSTLFDASLLSASQPPETAAPFFASFVAIPAAARIHQMFFDLAPALPRAMNCWSEPHARAQTRQLIESAR